MQPAAKNDEEKKLNKKATDSYDKTQSIKFDNKDLTDTGGIIKTSDRVKMGAAMADLLSAGLGFVPGANIASAGIGAASSLAEFGADVSDGLEWGDVGNLALNLGMDAVSLIPAMKSIKAAKAMDLKVAGVDIIRSSKGPLLLEVNSSPGLEGIEGATNKDIAGEMIKAIEKNFKSKVGL